jgi:hypothetical protein
MNVGELIALLFCQQVSSGNNRRRLDVKKKVVKLGEVLVDLLTSYPEFVTPFIARDDPDIYFLSCHF